MSYIVSCLLLIKGVDMKRFAAVFLCIAMLAAFVPSFSSYAVSPVSTLKIGLSYGDNGVPGAKLQNVSGFDSGYKVGFYDSNNVFKHLFTTYESEVTVIKDKAIWITSDNEYIDVKPSSHKYYIGPFNVQLDKTFDSYDSAMGLASTFVQMGYQAFPAFHYGSFKLRIGEFLTRDAAVKAADKLASSTGYSFNVVGESASCYTLTKTGTDRIIFELDSYDQPLGIQPLSKQTWYNKFKYYGGFEFRRVYGNDLTVINIVSMDDYLKGVIPYEVSPSWPAEAQKAQAVCAKCYACNNMGKHSSMGFDLCNTTDCQVYRGTNLATSLTDSVVDAVKGYYVTYNGEIAMTYYHSNSGGYTEDVENIWGKYIPYLRAVEDIYLENPKPYSVTVDLKTITDILQMKGYTNKKITDYYVSKRSASGNVMSVTFAQEDGTTLVLSSDKARTAINNSNKGVSIPSHRFTIETSIGVYINKVLTKNTTGTLYAIGADGEKKPLSANFNNIKTITDKGIKSLSPNSINYVINGTGSGHHVGMSQSGALGMAKKGFTYDQILQFYYAGVQITYFGY